MRCGTFRSAVRRPRARSAILLNDWQLSGVLTAGSGYQPGAIQANGAAQATAPSPTRASGSPTVVTTSRTPTRTTAPTRTSPARRTTRRRSSMSAIRARAARTISTRSSTRRAVTGPTLRQRRPRIGPLHPRRLPRPHGRHGDGQEHPVRRQRVAAVPLGRLQRVQRGDLQQPQHQRDLSQPDGPDHRQLAVPAGRLARSDPSDAENAGFGAATSAQPLRNMQLQIRFGF